VGTAPLGGLYAAVGDAQARATLEAAAAGGGTHFDTAPHYGRGLAEERLGAFLAAVRGTGPSGASLTVSTKVGRHVRPLGRRAAGDIFLGAPPGESVFDFSPAGVRAQLDASRARLRRDRIDVVLLHDPDDHLDEAPRAAEELARQRDQGAVGAIGVGTNRAPVAHHLLDRIDLDVVLLAGRMTLLDDSGGSVARRCARGGAMLLAAGVFQSGILAAGEGSGRGAGAGPGDAPPTATYDYLPAPEPVRRRVAEMRAVCAEYGVTLHRAAINHPRRHPGVTTTLVGVRSPDEVAAALDAIDADLPGELWVALDRIRERYRGPGGGP